jgi:hypothetical protein
VAERRLSPPEPKEQELPLPLSPDEPPYQYWSRLQADIAARRDARLAAAPSAGEQSSTRFAALIETMNAARYVTLLAIQQWKSGNKSSTD